MPKRVVRHAVTQPADPSYKFIPLTRNQNAVVDTEDFDELSKFNWYADWNEASYTFYAKRRDYSSGKPGKIVAMARQIMRTPQDMECDHRDGDGLNNRKYNLRNCTPTQNKRNGVVRKSNKIRYKGVIFCKEAKKKWRAQIMRGELTLTGYFDTAEEAARAYDEAAQALHGEFANLNFPIRLG